MSDSLILQMLSQLGELQQQVGVTLGQNSHIIAELGRASDSRSVLHKKLDLQGDGLADLASRIGAVETEIAYIKPNVEALIGDRRDRRAVRTFFRHKYTIGAAAIGGGVAGWHQWEKIAGFASRIFK